MNYNTSDHTTQLSENILSNELKTNTNLDYNDLKTLEIDKTNNISNEEFLSAIFGDVKDVAKPIIVSFSGNPNKVNKGNWRGKPLNDSGNTQLLGTSNNYFSLANFKPNKDGEYRRQKVQFYELYAVMLDDVGTKVLIERLTLAPSWLLETSPGNYQAGYILSVPINDPKVADQLMDAIICAKMCDPGAGGPTARLARLPVAVNGKNDPAFICQLKKWNPEKRYSVKELIDGLQLEIAGYKTKKNTPPSSTSSHDSNEKVWTPRPEENLIITRLKKYDLYKAPLSEGKHDITCPWINDHTNRVNCGTAYFEPDATYPLGGFKCQHGHCANRYIRNLLEFLDVDIKSASMKPTIRVIKGEINRIIDMAEHELSTGLQYFQRGGLIVFIYTDPSTNETLIQNITQPSLMRALSSIAIWEQYDKRSKQWERIDPPAKHTAILFDCTTYRYLPIIKGIARQPYLRPDGSLMTEPGYDKNTSMFGVFDSSKFVIPNTPTREDAISALNLLNGLLDEFPFSTEYDRSATLSAILTAAIRPCLILAPMFHVRAHAVGSGKSYLCDLITVFATPQQSTPTTFPAEDEECRKLLLAELLRSPPVIQFDNATSDILPHKSLCTTLTSEYISGRILGISKTVTVSTRTLLLSSGNNVSPIKDMTRRCVTINLNPEVEIPATRTFERPNLINEVCMERERFVAAAITVIRAYIVAGKPKTNCKTLSGYNDWSDLCRQAVQWLGWPDPAKSIFEALKGDPDRELLGRLLTNWWAVFKNIPTMVREAVNKSELIFDNYKELKEVLHDISDERGVINRHRLGRWIKRHEGQIVDGLRFTRCSGSTSAERWIVEQVSSVLSPSDNQNNNNGYTDEDYLRATKGE